MHLSFLLIGLLASVAVAERNIKPYRFIAGQTYVYDYSATLETGIPKISDQTSNYQIEADILIQAQSDNSNEVRLKLVNVKAGQTDGSSRADDVPKMRPWDREYERELVKPISFIHQNGQIVSFKADKSEPQWSINIKKSILSLFNLNLHPKDVLRTTRGNIVPKPVSQDDLTYYGVFEQGMAGDCETTYEINQIPSQDSTSEQFILNVTKTRNYENCKLRPVLVKDNYSLHHQEQQWQQRWSAVKGYYPLPYVSDSQRQESDAADEDKVVNQYNSVKYNISLTSPVAIIEGIFSEGRIVYNTFGDKIVAITQQNVTLKNSPEENDQQMIQSIERVLPVNSKTHEVLSFLLPNMQSSGPQSQQPQKMDIPHMILYGQTKTTELVRKMPEYFKIVAQEIMSAETSPESKDVMQRVIEIVNTFASLPRDALEELYRQIADQGRENASPEQNLMRKIFLDCLALSGTNDAALLIKQKIISHQVSSNEARELLEALPHNMYLPDVKTIDAYLELCQHPRVVNRPIVHTAAAVCFGKLVQTGNKKAAAARRAEGRKIVNQQDDDESNEDSEWDDSFTQKTITQEDIERYVVVASRLLEQADSFQKKVAAIEALAHMGAPEALDALKPYVTGDAAPNVVPGYEVEEGQDVEKEANYIRTIAIYATAHIAKRFPKQVQPMVLPVYRNTAEPHQLRLAAFTILMLCQPEQHVLQSIAADLERELDQEVVSFVSSALKSVGYLKTPCLQHLAKSASDISDSIPQNKRCGECSRFIARDYFDAKKSFGLLSLTEVVQSRRSPIPKAAYLSLTETTSQFHEQMLEIGFNAKGLEKLVHRIVGRNGLIASLLQNKQMQKPQKRNMVPIEEAVRVIRERVSSTLKSDVTKDSARLDLFFKLFERTSLYALDEAALYDLMDDFESAIDSWAKDYSAGYTGTYAKIFMPSSLMKVVPSELGLPVVVSHKNPLILSLKVKNAKLDRKNGFQVSGEIVPKCLHSSYTFLFGVVPAQKTAVGTHVEKTTQVSLPLKFRVGYKLQQNKWSVYIKPQANHQVFYHKTEAKTFVSRIHVATTPSRDWLETAQSLRDPDTSSAKMEKRLAYKNLPIAAQISLETEEKLQDPKYLERKVQKNGIIPTIVEIFQNPGINAREVRVTLQSQDSQSAFEYEWDLQQEYDLNDQDSGFRKFDQRKGQNEEESDEEDDSSEESQEQEWQDSVMGELFTRLNKVITGKSVEEDDLQRIRQGASKWMKKASQNMKWVEDNKEYEESDEESEWPSAKPKSNSCQTLKTTYVRQNDKVCFTTRPVLSCRSGCESKSLKQVTMPFHCLPQSSFTTQLMQDSERMVLTQLASKRVDFTRVISVPSSCVA